MSGKQKGLIAIILVALLSAGNSPIQKIGIQLIPPLTFAFIRFFIASLIILPFVFNNKKRVIQESWALFPITLFATVNIILFILGLKLTTATIAQLLYAAVPLLTGVIAFKLFAKKLKMRKLIGIIIGFMGITFVLVLPAIEKGTKFSGDIGGNLLIAMGAICYSMYLIVSEGAQKRHSPFIINNAFIFISTILLFPFFIFESMAHPVWLENITLSVVGSLIYTAVFGTLILYLFQQYAIKYGGSLFTSMSMYLTPAIAFILSYLLLGEELTIGLVIGAVLALMGVFLVTSR